MKGRPNWPPFLFSANKKTFVDITIMFIEKFCFKKIVAVILSEFITFNTQKDENNSYKTADR